MLRAMVTMAWPMAAAGLIAALVGFVLVTGFRSYPWGGVALLAAVVFVNAGRLSLYVRRLSRENRS